MSNLKDIFQTVSQCCGSMTFWGGSGSGCGSISLTNGSGCGSGSCYFRHWPSQNANKKLIERKSFFDYRTSWKYMYIIFKDKKSEKSHKAVGIKVFLLFLLGNRRIQIRIRIRSSDWWIRIRIQEAQKHVDPDSDPQHCFHHMKKFYTASLCFCYIYRYQNIATHKCKCGNPKMSV